MPAAQGLAPSSSPPNGSSSLLPEQIALWEGKELDDDFSQLSVSVTFYFPWLVCHACVGAQEHLLLLPAGWNRPHDNRWVWVPAVRYTPLYCIAPACCLLYSSRLLQPCAD
jgi:hypothetical protein